MKLVIKNEIKMGIAQAKYVVIKDATLASLMPLTNFNDMTKYIRSIYLDLERLLDEEEELLLCFLDLFRDERDLDLSLLDDSLDLDFLLRPLLRLLLLDVPELEDELNAMKQ